MALTKEEKQKIVGELKEKIDRQKSIVFVDFTGLKVGDLFDLRKKMKNQDGEVKVAKKSLISLALKDKKIELDAKRFQGEVALGFGYKDEISPFKLFHEFSKGNDKLKILGGLVAGEFYDKEKALLFAQMPSRDELLIKLFFAARSPLFAIPAILQTNLSILRSKV